MLSGITPMVHCSDGWDRTSQVCAITELIIDPYYRTIHGFFVLIEKDWVHYGHQFAKRLNISEGGKKDRAPIFVQFLDCIHQISIQNPTALEFNLEFLREMAYQAYSGTFGTFICDNQYVPLL